MPSALIETEYVKRNKVRLVSRKLRKPSCFAEKNRDFVRKKCAFSQKIFGKHFSDAKTHFSTFRDRENMR